MSDWSDLTDTDTAKDRALMIQVRGQEVPWLVDGKAIRVLNTRHNTDLSDILEAAMDLATQGAAVQAEDVPEEALEELPEEQRAAVEKQATPEDVMELTAIYGTVGRLLWAGAVRFEPSLSEEDVCGLVGPDNVTDLPLGEMIARAFPNEEEDDTAGKASPTARTS